MPANIEKVAGWYVNINREHVFVGCRRFTFNKWKWVQALLDARVNDPNLDPALVTVKYKRVCCGDPKCENVTERYVITDRGMVRYNGGDESQQSIAFVASLAVDLTLKEVQTVTTYIDNVIKRRAIKQAKKAEVTNGQSKDSTEDVHGE